MIKRMVSGSRFKVPGSKFTHENINFNGVHDCSAIQVQSSSIRHPASDIRLLFRYCAIIFLGSILLSIGGCGSGRSPLNIDVSGIEIPDVKIHRYDEALFRVKPANLQAELEKLRPEFPFFLDTDLSSPAKLAEMKSYLENPRNLDFYREVRTRFQNLDKLQSELTLAFRHFRYYYPSGRIPRVYSYISGGDYEYPIQFADSVMLIGLDNYLGKDFKAYVSDGVPAYRLHRMTSEHIIPDGMQVLAKVNGIAPMSGNTLLDEMIEAGKRLYFVDAMIPAMEDCFKIGYTQAQADWIKKNEAHVWAAIIENRMLYASDGQAIRLFMADGPFTAEFSKESPPRLGEWIGWQIVKRYMSNSDEVTLPQLMKETDAQKVLTQSKYKPEK